MIEYLKRKNNKYPIDIDIDEGISLINIGSHLRLEYIYIYNINGLLCKYIGQLQDIVHTWYTFIIKWYFTRVTQRDSYKYNYTKNNISLSYT